MAFQAAFNCTITGGTTGTLASTSSISHSGGSSGEVDFSTLVDIIKKVGKGIVDPGAVTFTGLIGLNAGYDTAIVGATTGTILGVRDITFSGIKRSVVDLTTFKSADRYRVKKPGRSDLGEITIHWFLDLGSGDASKHKTAIDRLSSSTAAENWTITFPDSSTLVAPAYIKGAKFYDAPDGDTGIGGELTLRSTAAWTYTNAWHAAAIVSPGVVETFTFVGNDTSSIATSGFVSGFKPIISDVDAAVMQEIEITLSGKPTITLGT